MNKPQLILASASPRRKTLLAQIGVSCDALPVDIDERAKPGESVRNYVSRLALEKAQKGWQTSSKKRPVLGADTIVVFEGQLLGKPENKAQAFETLKQLSGQTHQVYSAVAVVSVGFSDCLISVNEVTFDVIDESTIWRYIDSGEPMDKAGCYGIQGQAALWIKSLVGSYSSVMGLPLYETGHLLKKLDIIN